MPKTKDAHRATSARGDQKQLAAMLRDILDDDPVRALLIMGLDSFNKAARDLVTDPPRDSETMAALGLGDLVLDHFVRDWINEKFRLPNGLPFLIRGQIKTSTKFSELLAMCKPQEG